MNIDGLLNFLDSLEQKGVLNSEINGQIQHFITGKNASIGKLFLTLAAIIGALFLSAGVFAIISHNWNDFPRHLRGALSFVPSLVALFFYYKAVFKHPKSTSWIEASSLFLMLMIGASISLVSQTYQLDGDFDKFITVWLILTVPMFYIARASGIAVFYLLLSTKFLFPDIQYDWFMPSGMTLNEKYYLFWLFLFAFLPHFFLSLNRNSTRQSFRAIYLGWLIAIFLVATMPFAVKAGYTWWALALIMAFYLVGKKYYRHNISSLGRPFQTMALLHIFHYLLYFSNEQFSDFMFRLDKLRQFKEWTNEQVTFFIIGILLTAALTVIAILWRRKEAVLNRAVIFIPVLYVFMFGIFCVNDYYDVDLTWWSFLIFNIYALVFGVNAMVMGNRSGSVLYMIYGLFLVCFLLWARYFDMDVSFWLKGIFFMIVGLSFFLIHFLSNEEFKD
ncbi:MAG TPA: DUF2157 domain-containing protein [Fluviicola sp.]|nr:DUF2157 domain-containing protein [Fluviicola sp.]